MTYPGQISTPQYPEQNLPVRPEYIAQNNIGTPQSAQVGFSVDYINRVLKKLTNWKSISTHRRVLRAHNVVLVDHRYIGTNWVFDKFLGRRLRPRTLLQKTQHLEVKIQRG